MTGRSHLGPAGKNRLWPGLSGVFPGGSLRRSMCPLPIRGTALRAEVIRTDVRKGNGGRKVKIPGNCMKCFANVLTVLPGVALISAK